MTTSKKTALVIGGSGSAGQRRVRLIQDFGWLARTLDPNGGDYMDGESVPFKEFDAVFICSPPTNHAPWIGEFNQLGMNKLALFIEKPICMPDEVNRVKPHYEGTRQKMMVGHNLMWHKGFLKFRKESQNIGKHTLYLARFGNLLTNWLRDNPDAYSRHREQGGGVLLDCLQDIDVALDITGGLKPKAFHQALGHSDITSNSEHTAVVLAYQGIDSPILATMAFDYYRSGRTRYHEVVGEEGTAVWEENDRELIEASYKAETDAFLRWAAGGKKPNRPDPFRALEFIRAIYSL